MDQIIHSRAPFRENQISIDMGKSPNAYVRIIPNSFDGGQSNQIYFANAGSTEGPGRGEIASNLMTNALDGHHSSGEDGSRSYSRLYGNILRGGLSICHRVIHWDTAVSSSYQYRTPEISVRQPRQSYLLAQVLAFRLKLRPVTLFSILSSRVYSSIRT